MDLLAVDVGFSARRTTTGIAYLHGDCVRAFRVGSDPAERRAVLPPNLSAQVAAFDGPVLPAGTAPVMERVCERVFIRDEFRNRCKPGLSHHGFGLALRQACADTQAQLCSFLPHDVVTVEAFPNLFLGVLTPRHHFEARPRPKRGRRFDWLYERVATTRAVEGALRRRAGLPHTAWESLAKEKDHEKRAALVCLVTAALAANGAATKVGDDEGGSFWLPPWESWQPWAKASLERIVGGGKFPTLNVIVN